MSNPSERCFDLSTIKGVRVFGFAVAEAAKHLSGLAIEDPAHFKAAFDGLTRRVLDLGGDRSEKDLALQSIVTDFNFRDPRFLGYLETNKMMRMVLMDFRGGAFKIKEDHREEFFKKSFDKVALAEIRHVSLISEAIHISDDLLTRAERDLLNEPVGFLDPFERVTLETLFHVKGKRGNNGGPRIFDYRDEAALDAFCLWWNRKNTTDCNTMKYPAVETCARKVLEGGKYTLVPPGSSSAENQIEVANPDNIDAAVKVIAEITKTYISEYENAASL